jgi:hypothetical protein
VQYVDIAKTYVQNDERTCFDTVNQNETLITDQQQLKKRKRSEAKRPVAAAAAAAVYTLLHVRRYMKHTLTARSTTCANCRNLLPALQYMASSKASLRSG